MSSLKPTSHNLVSRYSHIRTLFKKDHNLLRDIVKATIRDNSYTQVIHKVSYKQANALHSYNDTIMILFFYKGNDIYIIKYNELID